MKTKSISKGIGMILAALQLALIIPMGSHLAQAGNRPMEQRKLLVTAYYSPLPNQSFYIRGSYEADIRLNGRGTNGADGTEVYEGMLAAPKTYPFGTRIKIPGLGVGEVHDRGGAIVARSGYDRVDVWMGRGEEGLARALNWGARFVEGEVYFTPHQVEPGLQFGWVSNALPSTFVKRLQNKPLQNPAVFNKEASGSSDIKELQEALSTFGHYHGEISGAYDAATKEAVLAFQLAEGVIPNRSAGGASVFGPKTREALKAKLESHNADVVKEYRRLEENRLLLEAGLGKEAEGDEVRALQRMLWELGYYKGDLNGDYDATTIDAVFEFQKEQGILSSEWDAGAGFYGKKTHSALTAAIQKKMEVVKSYKPVEMQVWVPAKIELPGIASLSAPKVSMERQALYFSDDISLNTNLVQKIIEQEAASEDSNRERFAEDLGIDDEGPLVSDLQDFLIEHGYLAKALNTGYYGYQTQSAVLKFQQEQGIVDNYLSVGAGRVGPATRAALNSL